MLLPATRVPAMWTSGVMMAWGIMVCLALTSCVESAPGETTLLTPQEGVLEPVDVEKPQVEQTVYRDPDGRFELGYDADWDAISDPAQITGTTVWHIDSPDRESSVRSSPELTDGAGISLRIEPVEVGSAEDIASYLTSTERYEKVAFDERARMVDGVSGFEYRYSDGIEMGTVTGFQDESWRYVLTFEYPDETSHVLHNGTFDRVIDGFRFL